MVPIILSPEYNSASFALLRVRELNAYLSTFQDKDPNDDRVMEVLESAVALRNYWLNHLQQMNILNFNENTK